MTIRKRYLVAIIGLMAIFVHLMITRTAPSQNTSTSIIYELSQGDIENVVTSQGSVEPKEYVDVGAQVSGQLKKLHVDIGDDVKKGQLIAEIDPQIYESKVLVDKAKLKTLRAQLKEQKAQITFAKKQYERNMRLIVANAVSKETLEDSETNYEVAKAQEESLKAQIEEAQSTLEGDETNLGYTKIYAPMDGTIVEQTTREGQTVNSSMSAPTIVTVANLDIMTIRAQVAEADINSIKVGMPVYFTTLSGDRKWEATVRQVLPTPEIINDVVLFNVLVDVDNKDRQLMSDMSTQMFFQLDTAQNVLLLNTAALGQRIPARDNNNGKAYKVSVMGKDNKLEDKIIYVGIYTRTEVEVKSGLAIGDKVTPPMNNSNKDFKPPMGPRI